MKHANLIQKLNLEQKCALLSGETVFTTRDFAAKGIPAITLSDGPNGVRKQAGAADHLGLNPSVPATCFPTSATVANSWDPALGEEIGEALGEEAAAQDVAVLLGPGLNIKRSPLCGRNFEYMSEDPVLTAAQGVAYIKGVQESDVAACAKHYAVNSQETDRLDVDETVSERALRELYLPAFEAAVRDGGVLSVMGAYNLVNGEQCCESRKLLDDILRGEYGFDGFVVSDWSAVKRTKESAEVGLDVEMSVTPNFDEYYFAQPLKKAVEAGEVKESDIDRKVVRVLSVMDALHMLGDARKTRKAGSYATLDHAAKALDVARESIVLLKNDGNLLPLDEHAMTRLLVVGANADRIHSNGGGSAVIKALHEVSPLLGLNGALGGNVEIEYVLGYDAKQVNQDESWQEESLENSKGSDAKDEERAKALRDEAVAKAREYAASGDPVLFVGGLDHEHDLEGRDRTDMRLPYGQDELIEALLDAALNTILTFVAGSPVEMPWAAKAKAIVWNWYAGCESGTALAEVLLGRVNPSGHLPETFPVALADEPAHRIGTFGLKGHVDYKEDIYVGYRYFDTKQVPVLFPFGHGLSYTSFEYSDLTVRRVDDEIRVSLTVRNTGKRAGKTVAQVYLGLEGTGEDRPAKELKGFAKVALETGESRQVEIAMPVAKALRYWSNVSGAYALAPQARVYVGESVEDIRLSGRVA